MPLVKSGIALVVDGAEEFVAFEGFALEGGVAEGGGAAGELVEDGGVGGIEGGGALKGRDGLEAVALALMDLADEGVDHEGIGPEAGCRVR